MAGQVGASRGARRTGGHRRWPRRLGRPRAGQRAAAAAAVLLLGLGGGQAALAAPGVAGAGPGGGGTGGSGAGSGGSGASPGGSGQVGAAVGVRPLAGPIVRGFDPPAVKWNAGHRGVDVAAAAGSVVVAPRSGVITYAAVLAGRPVLVLTHGGTRSTFEPVEPLVSVGTAVTRGQPIGRLVAGHACPAAACLHWGLKRAEEYLDPLSLLRGEVVLLSDAEAARIAGGG